MRTTFTINVPNHLIGVVGQILDLDGAACHHPQYDEAYALVRDFVDRVKSMSRQTGDNHMAYFPHGNSIEREE